MAIKTTDNAKKPLNAEEQAAHAEDLRWMAAPTLRELCGREPSRLLVFPHTFEAYGDKLDDQRILDIHGTTLETGNIMGFVGHGDTHVRISSRFATSDGQDYFLHYMLQRVFAIHLFDMKHPMADENIFDLLACLFPMFLKRAVRQGLYREYQTVRHNDAHVRGRIDINRHLQRNIPFAGKVAYETREYVYDNPVTELIRHTIEYIAAHPMVHTLLTHDDETKSAVGIIRAATSAYDRNARTAVINANLRPLSHPYFDAYRPLQRLCVEILRHIELKYGRDDDEIYGLLFDGAWLWEEYLDTFLRPLLHHTRNRTGEGKLCLFANEKDAIYPDFHNATMVLDAKYKGYKDWNVQRPDLYQVISYMHVMNLKKGGFIVPVRSDIPSRTLNHDGGTMSVYGMAVDFCGGSYEEFCQHMADEEGKLYAAIHNASQTA